MTHPLFSGGWVPDDVPSGSRIILQLTEDPIVRDWQIDQLCHFWHRQCGVTTYLDVRAPFLENLSMLENFWLPQAWRRPCPLKRVYLRAKPYLFQLGWSQNEFERLMLCRPGDLSPAVLGRAQLLRAAISMPDWVLIDASWFERSFLPVEQALFLASSLFGESRWLIFGPLTSSLLPEDVIWSTIGLDTISSLGGP